MARRLLADSALVAVGTLLGSVLSYGFSFALAHQLDQTGYGQIGALLMIFLVASIPATAIQAVAARRVAGAGGVDPERLRALTAPLAHWSLLIGVVQTAALAALAPAVHAMLPSVSSGEVVWTALLLAPNALLYCYLGVAQGASRFRPFAALFVAMNSAKTVAGLWAGVVGASPGLIMGFMAASWILVAAAGHYALRDLIGPPHLQRGLGYVRELGTASWSLGAVLLLSLLDGLFAAHYSGGEVLGRYQAGAMFTRAGYFGPQFVGVLAYPRLAVPETRRRALMIAMALSAGIGLLVVGCTAVAADPAVRYAFGAQYLRGSGFDLPSGAWLFASAGAAQALVQLALLDAVARRSHAIGWLVFGGIAAEAAVILTVAHHSARQLIATAACFGAGTAAVSLTVSLLSGRHEAARRVPAEVSHAATDPGYVTATSAIP
jgi:O-antigen/teichoic acid export membrane protein